MVSVKLQELMFLINVYFVFVVKSFVFNLLSTCHCNNVERMVVYKRKQTAATEVSIF